jgi:hypothetical protein
MPRHTHLLRRGSRYYLNIKAYEKELIRKALKTSDPHAAAREVRFESFRLDSDYAINLFWAAPKLEYRDGKTPFSPHGSATFCKIVASDESAIIVTVIQQAGEGFYESNFTVSTESEPSQ